MDSLSLCDEWTRAAMSLDAMCVTSYEPEPSSYDNINWLDYYTKRDLDLNYGYTPPVIIQEPLIMQNVDPMLSGCPKEIEYLSDSLDNSSDSGVVEAFIDIPNGLSIINPMDRYHEFAVMVNPKNGTLVTHPVSFTEMSKKEEPQISPKPYHWSQDHDYWKKSEDENEDVSMSAGEVSGKTSDSEAIVEVWEIEKFGKESPAVSPQQSPSYHQKPKEPRRKSTRNAEFSRQKEQARKISNEQARKISNEQARKMSNEQARKISNAVHAVFKQKSQRRQYKNIKPKNSVETTPSQSDIEEWCSQPVRPTYTKITKKKTSKGRIDHSESERHRREVLRRNFSSLCDLIPNEYLRGEKASSQISKQKILNGAKAYILEVNSVKSSYKALYSRNTLLREKFHKKTGKLLKCIKKQK